MESKKFRYVERNLNNMINKLSTNQNLIRYIKYLSDAPLEQKVYGSDGILITQPDFNLPYDLIGDGSLDLRLFNPFVEKDKRVKLFFSHRRVHFIEPKATAKTIYKLNIIVPYENEIIQTTKEIRTIRIADEVCRELDNQVIDGIGIGKIFCTRGKSYIIDNDNSYSALQLRISVKDITNRR